MEGLAKEQGIMGSSPEPSVTAMEVGHNACSVVTPQMSGASAGLAAERTAPMAVTWKSSHSQVADLTKLVECLARCQGISLSLILSAATGRSTLKNDIASLQWACLALL